MSLGAVSQAARYGEPWLRLRVLLLGRCMLILRACRLGAGRPRVGNHGWLLVLRHAH